MGLFDKLFEKKICDICGGEIGLLGNRKLADGNMCKECAKKLSPNLSDRREMTIAQINEHLAYREANREIVESIEPTRILGDQKLVIIDEGKKLWLLADSSKFRENNPDVFRFEDVIGSDIDIDETKTEITKTDEEGKEISYNPPRYSYEYRFAVNVRVSSKWFDQFNIRVNRRTVEGKNSVEYKEAMRKAEEIREAFEQMRTGTYGQEAVQEPKYVTCPFCRATTLVTPDGKCEYCGGAIEEA